MRTSMQQKLMLSAMVISLGLVLIYASGMLGNFGYVLLAFSSVFIYVLTAEDLYGTAAFAYLITTGLAYLIAPDKVSVAVFGVLMGHYPIFKDFIDRVMQNVVAKMCVKLLYCNAWIIGALCFVLLVLKIPLGTLTIPKWAVVLICEAALVAIDCVHSFCRWIYTDKIRSGIVHKK